MTICDIIYSELTSTEKLATSATPREFRRWKSKMEFVLFDANVKYVLSDPKPSDPSSDPSPAESSSSKPSDRKTTLDRWVSDDERCKAMILFAMDDLLFDAYNLHETSKQIMDSVAEIFQPDCYASNLVRKYTTLKMDEDTPINDHLLEMRALAVDLDCAGMHFNEGMQKSVIMQSLPQSWGDAKMRIIVKRNMSLEDFMRQLRMEGEFKNTIREEEEEEEELESERKKQRTGNREFKGNCFNCGEPGHCKKDCPN